MQELTELSVSGSAYECT